MADFIVIRELDDPRLADYVSVRERDLTGRDGKFIVEGRVTLNILLTRSRFAIDSLFLSETRIEPLKAMLAQVPDTVPVYVAPQAVMDAVVGFPIHRGILACARKGPALDLSDVTGADTLLVLNQISNHDNVGAAFRNAAAFGAGGVILDEQSCDPLYRKAIRVAAGTSLWLPFVQASSGIDQITALRRAGYVVWAMTPRPSAPALHVMPVPDKLAILLGAEGPGLPDTLIDLAEPVRIPMMAGFDSVNVATAGAIALAHAFPARSSG